MDLLVVGSNILFGCRYTSMLNLKDSYTKFAECHCHIHLVFDGANVQNILELSAGIEPTTCSLQMSGSAN